MVKFGRHLQFYMELVEGNEGKGHVNQDVNQHQHQAAQENSIHDFLYEQSSSFDKDKFHGITAATPMTTSTSTLPQHYIVPYNTLRNAIESPDEVQGEVDEHQQHQEQQFQHQNQHQNKNKNVMAMTPSSFELAWREALQKSNSDFFESINSCWKSVFDSISSSTSNSINKDAMRGIELMDAIHLYTEMNSIVTSRDLLCFLKDTYNIAEMNYQALRKIVKKFDKKYYTIHGRSCNGSGNGSGSDGELLLSTVLLPELYSSTLYFGRMTLRLAIDNLRVIIEEMSSTPDCSETGGSDDGNDAYSRSDSDTTIHHNNHNHNNVSDSHRQKDLLLVGVDTNLSKEDEGGRVRNHRNQSQNQSLGTLSKALLSGHQMEKNTTMTLPALIPPSNIQHQLSKQPKQQPKHKEHKGYQNHNKSNNNNNHNHHGQDRDDLDEEMAVNNKRANEILWLNDIVKNTPQSELKHIVAHRGFHTSQGRSDYRPLENSLSAFETAWSAGIHLCECDVALTKDEKLGQFPFFSSFLFCFCSMPLLLLSLLRYISLTDVSHNNLLFSMFGPS